jgi:plasmid replication initiation protein
MNEALMASAYQIARENYKSAELATFKSLDSTFEAEKFDAIHQASQRGMRLHVAAMELAQKVGSRMISYEKAEEILRNQFTEFPDSTRQKALSDSYTDTR